MIKQRFHCLNCGHEFAEEVFEPGEAERKMASTRPVSCPKCNRRDLRKDR